MAPGEPAQAPILPCLGGLRRMAVWLPRIDRLVFALQVNDLGDWQHQLHAAAHSGLAAAILRSKC